MFSAKKRFEQGWYAKIERAAPLIPGASLHSIWRARSRGIPFFAWRCDAAHTWVRKWRSIPTARLSRL